MTSYIVLSPMPVSSASAASMFRSSSAAKAPAIMITSHPIIAMPRKSLTLILSPDRSSSSERNLETFLPTSRSKIIVAIVSR